MTVNPCRLCAPLGAVVAMKGFAGMMPILHGSQGCATYIRRYLISHFREPVDVASSSFTEETAIFGGEAQLLAALRNVAARYRSRAVGIASTCLSETIGDDVALFMKALEREGIPLMQVSTPSYRGSHPEGFRDTVRALLDRFCGTDPQPGTGRVLLTAGLVSPADLRLLGEYLELFGLEAVIAPDYSRTLDGGSWEVYHPLAPGGTDPDRLAALATGTPWIVLSGGGLANGISELLERRLGPGGTLHPYPIGIEAGDALVESLRRAADAPVPPRIENERLRLLDAYADCHKYLSGVRAGVVADADLADGLVRFLAETGVEIAFVAAPDEARPFAEAAFPVAGGIDHGAVEGLIDEHHPDILFGSSKLYPACRSRSLPLVRVGFPVHDRVGGARLLHLGYRGTLELLDRTVNLLLEERQNRSEVGYAYL